MQVKKDNMQWKYWIEAARLRTLPLSLSGIITGTFLAAKHGRFSWQIVLLAFLTTVGFQVLSNFANDYGDGVKGTDNAERIGPKRALQSGNIQPQQMLWGISITAVVTFVLALVLIYVSFGDGKFYHSILFLLLGIASILAAIKYTMGKNAYGYSGFGDLFVFLFFGLLGVLGSAFLQVKSFYALDILPACAIGFLSVGVLNLNNMRDRASDLRSQKNTLVVKMGADKAKSYHEILLLLAFSSATVYVLLDFQSPYQFLFLGAFLPIAKHGLFVRRNSDAKDLDPELKKLALSTFLFALLFGLGQLF